MTRATPEQACKLRSYWLTATITVLAAWTLALLAGTGDWINLPAALFVFFASARTTYWRGWLHAHRQAAREAWSIPPSPRGTR